MRRITCILGSALLLLSIQAYTQTCRAQTVHLTLTVAGEELEGSSTVTSLEREGTIPCLSYADGLILTDRLERTPPQAFEPIVCTKDLDQTSPRLWQAFESGERVAAEFMFFRTRRDGTEERFFTVRTEDAQVASIHTVLTDLYDPNEPQVRIFEEVAFIFRTIVRTHDPSGAEYRSGGG